MPKQTTLDDIAESINDLTTIMAAEFGKVYDEFGRVRQEMDRGFASVTMEFADVRREMRDGFTEVHVNQRETNRRLEALEGDSPAHEADIKELYKLKSKR